jgi:hypothetical protein
MPNIPEMKYTLYRRTKRNGDEVVIGRSFVWLVWVILAFILIVLGRSLAGFLHWP